MFPYSTILKEIPIFTFINSTFTNIKVKITTKMNPYQKFNVTCCKCNVLLLVDPVEEAKLNNCSTHIFQTLHEDRVS